MSATTVGAPPIRVCQGFAFGVPVPWPAPDRPTIWDLDLVVVTPVDRDRWKGRERPRLQLAGPNRRTETFQLDGGWDLRFGEHWRGGGRFDGPRIRVTSKAEPGWMWGREGIHDEPAIFECVELSVIALGLEHDNPKSHLLLTFMYEPVLQ